MPRMPPAEDVASSEDRDIPGPAGDIPVRIYQPLGAEDATRPGVVYLPGGGGVRGVGNGRGPGEGVAKEAARPTHRR